MGGGSQGKCSRDWCALRFIRGEQNHTGQLEEGGAGARLLVSGFLCFGLLHTLLVVKEPHQPLGLSPNLPSILKLRGRGKAYQMGVSKLSPWPRAGGWVRWPKAWVESDAARALLIDLVSLFEEYTLVIIDFINIIQMIVVLELVSTCFDNIWKSVLVHLFSCVQNTLIKSL